MRKGQNAGEKHWNFGKHHSNKTKQRISKTLDKGRKIKICCLICAKDFERYLSMGDRKYCSRVCYGVSRKGIKRPEHSAFLKGKVFRKGFKTPDSVKRKLSEAIRREKHYNWKGGISTLTVLLRNCVEYTIWRKSVFERDNYTCIWCGDDKGGNLEADHIKPFYLILKLNEIINFKQGLLCKELWETKNGRTLCHNCHILTDTYGINSIKSEGTFDKSGVPRP